MVSGPSQQLRQRAPLYLACYLAWIALSALGLWTVFLLRDNLNAIAIRFALATGRASDSVSAAFRVRAIDNVGTITLGLLWLAGVVLLEGYLRDGVRLGRFWARAARALAVLAVVVILSYGLRALL